MRPPSRLFPLLAAAALGVTLAALPASAQHPNMAQGFRPEHTFATAGGIENINLLNGALTLVIPIGPSYPVGPGFSVGFTLTYAGSPWAWELTTDSDPPNDEYLQALTRKGTVAGLGWDLSFGRMRSAADPGNTSPNPQYQSPDQAFHTLTAALHDAGIGFLPSQPVAYTTDGTYLRRATSLHSPPQ